MSANNGNRSRFNITRKRRIARAILTRSLKEQLATKSDATAAPKRAAAKKKKPADAPEAN